MKNNFGIIALTNLVKHEYAFILLIYIFLFFTDTWHLMLWATSLLRVYPYGQMQGAATTSWLNKPSQWVQQQPTPEGMILTIAQTEIGRLTTLDLHKT